MKRFLIRILSFIGIPFVVLIVVYLITDPFKMLRPFGLEYFDQANRDYISSELFLRNDPIYHYNSFVFGSSRCGAFNTYHWKQRLQNNASPFLFQAWGESLTGIEQKISFIDNKGNDIDNVLVLLDIPGAFDKKQLRKDVKEIKDYKVSGQSQFVFQMCLFYGFAQKPSKWISSIQQYRNPVIKEFPFDTISNDWIWGIKIDTIHQPKKDSLMNCSPKTKEVFLKQIEFKSDGDLVESKPLITNVFIEQLKHLKHVFDKHHTDYRIVISPTYCYTNPSINAIDLGILQDIFGKDKVFNYSGKNDITTDCYNFSDPDHFGLCVGWQIIEDIYNK